MRHYAYPQRRYMYALGCLGAGGMIVIMLPNKFLPIAEHHEEAHEDKPVEATAGAEGTGDRPAFLLRLAQEASI